MSSLRVNIILLLTALALTAAHASVGFLRPMFDWDILAASLPSSTLSASAGRPYLGAPVLAHSPLHGLLAAGASWFFETGLLTGHLIASLVFLFFTLFLMMALSFRISGQITSAMVGGGLLAITRAALRITRASENDFSAAPFLVVLLFLLWRLGKGADDRKRRLQLLFGCGFFLAFMLIGHVQMWVAFIPMAIIAGYLGKGRSKHGFLSGSLIVGFGALAVFIALQGALSLILGLSPFSGSILWTVGAYLRAFLSDSRLFFFASDSSLLIQLGIVVRSFGLHTLGGWFHFGHPYVFWAGLTIVLCAFLKCKQGPIEGWRLLFGTAFGVGTVLLFVFWIGPVTAAAEFSLVLVSSTFWLVPVVDLLPVESNSEVSRRLRFCMVLLTGVLLVEAALYEPLSPERWTALLVLLFWQLAIRVRPLGQFTLRDLRSWLIGLPGGLLVWVVADRLLGQETALCIAGIASYFGALWIFWNVLNLGRLFPNSRASNRRPVVRPFAALSVSFLLLVFLNLPSGLAGVFAPDSRVIFFDKLERCGLSGTAGTVFFRDLILEFAFRYSTRLTPVPVQAPVSDPCPSSLTEGPIYLVSESRPGVARPCQIQDSSLVYLDGCSTEDYQIYRMEAAH